MKKKELWQKIIHFAITILTAIATTLGTTSCIGLMQLDITKRENNQCCSLSFVGVAGFEPTTPCSQSRCANRTALHPETLV